MSRNVITILDKGIQYNLSKNVKNKRKNKLGLLFIHWGIHHLHLGRHMESDGFVERTGPLLFCRFDAENAYFINVLPHSSTSWTDQDMIRILHDNWPRSMEMYQLKGVIGLSETVTNESIHTLRSENINSLIKVRDGVVYGYFGGGIMSNGMPATSVLAHDRSVDELEDLEKFISEYTENIIAISRSLGSNPSDSIQFRLRIINGWFFAEEVNRRFNLYVEEGRLKCWIESDD